MSKLIEVGYAKGIHLPEADLWLDPHFGVERAFISHAHSDHVARHGVTYCSELTQNLILARYGKPKKTIFQTTALRETVDLGEWQLRQIPSGHISGATMLHLTRKADGATLLYTGDYKLRPGLSAEPCELEQADVLIMETTFGLPRYAFPPLAETVEAMRSFVTDALCAGAVPVLYGYSLGKAQEILCALLGLGVPIMAHPSVCEMTAVVASTLPATLEVRPFDAREAAGHVLVFPPGAQARELRKLGTLRTAMCTGWALDASAKYRYGVDEIFPLSDHADYAELIETVKLVNPKRVYTVHGFTREFAADLRRLGFDAWSLERADQLELALDT